MQGTPIWMRRAAAAHRAPRRLLTVAALWLLAGVTIAGEGPPEVPNRSKKHAGMVLIPGGWFTRGGKYEVEVRSFFIDRYEVTNEEFCRFLNDGHPECWFKDQEIEKSDGRFAPKQGKDRWPVYAVAWHEATAYAKWAGKRLPTEAQWEWAARGKEGRKYPWGNEPITPKRANFGGNVGHPLPVGSFPEGKTPQGVFDMSGNVAEWCRDWYDPGYYAQAPEDNPQGPKKAGEARPRRVRRGGCWAMTAEHQASAARGASALNYRPKCVGIRCVREIPASVD